MDEVQKLLSLISYLKKNPSTSYLKLADLLGVSESQIRKDVQKLLMCGVPPYYSTDYIAVYDNGKGVTVDFVDHFKRPVKLSLTEFSALQAALSEFGDLQEQNNEVVEKLKKKLAKATVKSSDLADINKIIEINIASQNLNTRVNLLKHSISSNLKILLQYFSISKKQIIKRLVHPYMILRVKNSLYLRAYCELRQDLRLFKIDRIKNIEITKQTFTPLSNNELEKLSRKSITYIAPRKLSKSTTFKIRFSEKVAKYIQEEWAQKYWSKQKNGEIIFQAPIIDEAWVVRYVFSFGRDAELLEPISLIERLQKFNKNIYHSCLK